MASAISIPATNREDIFRPMLELSENLRRAWLRDRAMKAERRIGMCQIGSGWAGELLILAHREGKRPLVTVTPWSDRSPVATNLPNQEMPPHSGMLRQDARISRPFFPRLPAIA